MSRLGPKEIPKTIYHYCSLETFNSIITNKTLRLSDITKSNDSKELIYIRPFIKEEFLKVEELLSQPNFNRSELVIAVGIKNALASRKLVTFLCGIEEKDNSNKRKENDYE